MRMEYERGFEMGVNDRVQDKKDDSRRRAQETKKDRIGSRRAGGVADWQTVNAELVVKAVCAIAAQGGALRLGYTRDGGAYAVGIYHEGDSYTVYANQDEGIEPILQEVIDDFGKG